MNSRYAFTLIELLVVIAVIGILAALLFPVFAIARDKARQAACVSNFKQQATGILLYQQDYDEFMPLTYYGNSSYQSPPDILVGQFLQPYFKNQQIYNCPSDPANDEERATTEMVPPTTSQQRAFNLGFKNDFAYNRQYLCPVGTLDNKTWFSVPTALAAISAPSQTILGVDSVWNRDAAGNTYGGGGASADPPCRYYSDGADSFPAPNAFADLSWWGGWQPSHPKWGNVYGFAWPWHGEFATTAFCDGHVKALRMEALAAGCDVKDAWGGKIIDKEKYLWDLQ